MSKGTPFAEQSREEIVRSTINASTSKNLWTFSKEKRFPNAQTPCPYHHQSSQNRIWVRQKASLQLGIGSAIFMGLPSFRSKAFSDSWFRAEQRSTQYWKQVCIANSYIGCHPEQNPGPGRYGSLSEEKKKGYSMRPKTANSRTYFIDNKELKLVPSPFEYNIPETGGKQTMSKFRTVTLGNVGMQTKGERFREYVERTPSPFVYNPKKSAISKFAKGGKMGRCTRLSFVDTVANSSFTPGPGNYKAPSEFGHYKSKGAFG